jgi:hypothetical protein
MKHLPGLLIVAGLVLFGAGCAGKPQVASPIDALPTAVTSTKPADKSATTSTADAPSTTDKHWDRTETPTGIAFVPPKGYWVYAVEETRTHYLIAGATPAVNSADPWPGAYGKAVASFGDLQNDPKSFPTWDGFTATMAQFACTSGTTEDDIVTCSNKPTNIVDGKTAGGFPYRQFSLPATLKKTGASRGVKNFIAVRFGDKSQDGVLFTILNQDGIAPALELTKTMKMK